MISRSRTHSCRLNLTHNNFSLSSWSPLTLTRTATCETKTDFALRTSPLHRYKIYLSIISLKAPSHILKLLIGICQNHFLPLTLNTSFRIFSPDLPKTIKKIQEKGKGGRRKYLRPWHFLMIKYKLNHHQMEKRDADSRRPFFVVLNPKGSPAWKVGLMSPHENARYEELM